MKKIFLSLLTLAALNVQAQQSELAMKYANTITTDDLFDYLGILASDALEGRETGERGQRMAAALISHHFQSEGLVAPVKNGDQMSYYQNVPLVSSKITKAYLKIGKKQYDNFNKTVFVGTGVTNGEMDTQIVFVGNGDAANYEGIDVAGKAVLLFTENNYRKTVSASKVAAEKGAKLVLVVRTSTDEMLEELITSYRGYLEAGRMSVDTGIEADEYLGMFYTAPSLMKDLVGKNYEKLKELTDNGSVSEIQKVKQGKFAFGIEKEVKKIKSENVMGYLEGTDLKDELVVITSHYDHLGRRGDKIFNGADDDGSGTAGVMELAQAFAMAKAEGNGPRRSLLFLAFTGEEKGLLGSEYYADHPVFPLANTITNLNMDMIGRNDEDNYKDKDYVCLVGSDKLSQELHDISEQVNATYTNLDLNYVYNDENHPEQIYYRSDHWNFAKNGIPVIFYTTGSHDDYHKETDTIEKIEKDVYLQRTKLVFYTAWELVNRDKRPALTVK
ncbi:M28 family metallopeptidase [Reichenbachiella carrageenanivorans]|uniref:M28 family metallopeptidase n=1 Tax=Reichenbachiella carrageenanivorans TaxID=2979869 RepID=A0ABY6D207_9BACT|nr:M28 family metallopeptidase [Reichenbachiella carrageenanivorans]UXX79128.1 M28 family metallopeptidase [Reichenbachiella carrageenanivorans]